MENFVLGFEKKAANVLDYSKILKGPSLAEVVKRKLKAKRLKLRKAKKVSNAGVLSPHTQEALRKGQHTDQQFRRAMSES